MSDIEDGEEDDFESESQTPEKSPDQYVSFSSKGTFSRTETFKVLMKKATGKFTDVDNIIPENKLEKYTLREDLLHKSNTTYDGASKYVGGVNRQVQPRKSVT